MLAPGMIYQFIPKPNEKNHSKVVLIFLISPWQNGTIDIKIFNPQLYRLGYQAKL
jgi:hypothetical protein